MDERPTDPLVPHPRVEVDFAAFDDLVASIRTWVGSLPEWAPTRPVRATWEAVEPRLDRARRELSRLLVVGVVGGTGTGKSTLVNALAGGDVSPAGDVARPTTIAPIVVAAPDVDLGWLPLESIGARVVRSAAPAVANIVLVDCPDPDTQSLVPVGAAGADAGGGRPSDTNHNRDRLEAILPVCDVLLLVATAQKYRSWIVAREVAAFAPGRPLLFVQTHASRDHDIRADWQKQLEEEGFVVPRIFRLDGVEAARRAAAGLGPEEGFAALSRAIDEELAGRAARRVRRTGSLDLAGWFLTESRRALDPFREPVAGLGAGVASERTRLETRLATAVTARLRAGRQAWQRLLTDELVDRWHGGPFALFLHAVAALSSLWPRGRTFGGGVIGRLLAGQPPAPSTAGRGAWQQVHDLGIGEAEVDQSRSVLVGLAARARLQEPLVGRAHLDESAVQATVGTLLERTGLWLAAGIDRLVADRRGRLDGPGVRWLFESAFSGLLVTVLVRAGYDFFYGHMWLGRPVGGAGFLQEAIVWLLLWGLVLRWLLIARLRAGLDRDIDRLVAGLREAHLVDPLLADFAAAADRAGRYLAEGERLETTCTTLTTALDEPNGGLGRLRGKPS
jgi:energy-coupling factor transporter ATP-binding protein EcfA2